MRGEVMYNIMRSLWRDESGATAIEYGLIVGVMAAVLVTVLGVFGESLKELFNAIVGKLDEAADEITETAPPD
jgi:pilus assembly protein Flp/PilA